jgi:hypothetical protein
MKREGFRYRGIVCEISGFSAIRVAKFVLDKTDQNGNTLIYQLAINYIKLP